MEFPKSVSTLLHNLSPENFYKLFPKRKRAPDYGASSRGGRRGAEVWGWDRVEKLLALVAQACNLSYARS